LNLDVAATPKRCRDCMQRGVVDSTGAAKVPAAPYGLPITVPFHGEAAADARDRPHGSPMRQYFGWRCAIATITDDALGRVHGVNAFLATHGTSRFFWDRLARSRFACQPRAHIWRGLGI